MDRPLSRPGHWPLPRAGASVFTGDGLADGATDPLGPPELEGRAVAGGASVGSGVGVKAGVGGGVGVGVARAAVSSGMPNRDA
ncbi:MAG TPA: hypothetical protein VGE81_11895, partial [Candidatus Limnocylindrales bacterium]